MRPFAEDDVGSKEKILRETVRLIKAQGIEAITVRKIAAAAEVNVGAINYYFGSKDELIDLAANEIVDSFQRFFSVLEDAEIPPRERLRTFLTAFVKNHMRCSGPIKRVMSRHHETPHHGAGPASHMQRLIMGRLSGTVSEITGEQDPQLLYTLSMQLVCAAMFPNIIAHHTGLQNGLELPEVERQIDILLQHILK